MCKSIKKTHFLRVLLWFLVGFGAATAQASGSVQILVTVHNDSEYEANLFRGMQRSGALYAQYENVHRAKVLLARIAKEYGLSEPVAAWQVDSISEYCAVYVLDDDTDVGKILAEIAIDKKVASVQRMVTYQTAASSISKTPSISKEPRLAADMPLPSEANQEPLSEGILGYNDPYFIRQYAESASTVADMHKTTTGSGVTVGLIDTLVDAEHIDFKGLSLRTLSTVPGGLNEQRIMTHGTAMLGVIAAQPANGAGIVGLAPSVDIVSLGACWYPQRQSAAVCNSLSIAAALDLALREDVDIINMSLAGPKDPLVSRVIAKLLDEGKYIIASDPLLGENRYPARLPGVFAVSDSPDQLMEEGNHDDAAISIAIGELLSTAPFGTYDFYSGSSMSSAFATGLIALYLSGGQVEMLKDSLARDLALFHFESSVK